MPADATDAAIMLRTQWTWQEYLAQPDIIVDRMLALMNAEAEAARMKMQEKH